MKTFIWSLPIRIFHWLFAFGFATAYILGENEISMNFHYALGVAVGLLAFFRILFGFFGPKYAHFSDFPVSIPKIMDYLINLKTRVTRYYGHNPLAALAMIGMLIFAILTSFSGLVMYLSEIGYVAFDSDVFEDFHEVSANIFLILVIAHLLGLLLDFVFHNSDGTLLSMISGYKNGKTEETKLNKSHSVFALFALLLAAYGSFLAYQFAPIDDEKGDKTEQHDKTHSDDHDDDDDDD
jgi:cytochrome b